MTVSDQHSLYPTGLRKSDMVDGTDWSRAAAFWLAASVVATGAMIAAAALNGLAISINWSVALKMVAILGALAACHRYYRGRPQEARLSAALGALFAITVAGSAGGVISQVGQTFAFPTIDRWLATADGRLGLSCIDLISAVTGVPGLPSVLRAMYVCSIPLIILSAIALPLLGRARRAWELCAAFAFCMLVATVVSSLFPAAGAFEYLTVPADLRAKLPDSAGECHLAMFHQLRAASSYELNPFRLEVLVTFPSFHTAMALMTAAAWRDDRLLRWPMWLWNAAVIVSTIPIGGHYFIDLAAGFGCWLLIFRWHELRSWMGPFRPFHSKRASAPA